jgi:hypothetical protein
MDSMSTGFAKEAISPIKDCIEQTLKKEEERLKSLNDVAEAIQTMVITELSDFEPHLEKITGRGNNNKAKLSITNERCVHLANQHNAVYHIFSNLWLELGESIRSLIIGNYLSVSRSLKWMIESVIFYADFQEDCDNASELFDSYLKEESPLREKRYLYLLQHIDDSNYELLDDRLLLKEKFDTKFKIIREQLQIFGDAGYPKEVKGIPGELSELYRKFSGLSHISQQSIEERERDEEDLIFFLDNSFDKHNFHEKLGDIWRVMDLVTALILLVCSRFYGYSSVKEFLENIVLYHSSEYTRAFIKIAQSKNVKVKLPRFLSLIQRSSN